MQGPGKKRKFILISVILYIILFGIIDFVIGYFLIPQPFNKFRVRNSIYHHGLTPYSSSKAVWGPIIYPFYTNSLSFRDLKVRDVPLKKSKNKRILILGDSHSEGVGVEYRYTFAGRLQELGEQFDVEILNASAVSYSPKIHFLKGDYLLNTMGLEVDEIWVVIDISDLQNEIAYAGFESSKPKGISVGLYWLSRYLKYNSFSWYSISSIMDYRDLNLFNEAMLGFQRDLHRLPSRTSLELYKEFFRHMKDEHLLRDPNFHGVSQWIYDPNLRELADQGLELGMDNIAKLINICRDKNIQMRLSVHPWQTQVLKGDTTDYYVDLWRNFCETNNIDFINLYPLFINHENSLWVVKTCYIEGDNHWNELGHERVAKYLSKYLEN